MPDATRRPIAEWRETEWLQHLQRQAQQLTACPQSAADLAHSCLIAFYDHHRCYPWQHHEPAHALRWCCQKLRALACDAHRHAERHPCLALDTLPESVACVDIAAQVQADIDGERFVASLPPRLRAAVELRLAGYSWDEAAQQLGVSASTLRGYLPDLRAKVVEFFGYDPSKRGLSLMYMEEENRPSPEGTLARWSSDEPNSYARVFGYDEEGRLVKIERDYGSGGVQVAYEYGYNSDGVRVWQRDMLNGQEYRYVCQIGCGGAPMRVYNRPMRRLCYSL